MSRPRVNPREKLLTIGVGLSEDTLKEIQRQFPGTKSKAVRDFIIEKLEEEQEEPNWYLTQLDNYFKSQAEENDTTYDQIADKLLESMGI